MPAPFCVLSFYASIGEKASDELPAVNIIYGVDRVRKGAPVKARYDVSRRALSPATEWQGPAHLYGTAEGGR